VKGPTDNPKSNLLPAGLTEGRLDQAISASGYPLQSRISGKLMSSFESVDDEWGYIDRDTNTYRTLDILATQRLWQFKVQRGQRLHNPLRIRPNLTVLIECKQSELPYLFFQSSIPKDLHQLPLVVGLRHSKLELSTRGTRSTWIYGIPAALSLPSLPFIKDAPATCSTFSRVARKGNDLELTGSDVYSGVVQPLLKAALHLETIYKPRSTFAYLDCAVVVLLAVIFGPMVVVKVAGDSHSMSYAPWIRVLRQEPIPGAQHFDTHRMFAIDCVHSEYLGAYLDNHLLPFAREFGIRAERHHEELYHGRGSVPSEKHFSGPDLEARLKYKKGTDNVKPNDD
jgi:hypothetical protein